MVITGMYCAMCYAMCCIPQISIKHAHMHFLACDKKNVKRNEEYTTTTSVYM